jgi:hypothetical protein
MKGMKFEEILADPLRRLNAMYESERQNKASTKATTSAGAGTLLPFAATVALESSAEGSARQTPIVAAAPTPQTVAETLGRLSACWVLEDFTRLNQQKGEACQCMKMFMDMGTHPDLKMIFIGAVNSGREVIQFDPEMRHRISEIHVPLMTASEIQEILSLGERHLNVNFDYRIKSSIIALSNGLAAVAHQLALHFCHVRGIESTQPTQLHLDTSKWRMAIQRYLEDSQDTLKAAFDKSLKNLKKRKYDHGRLMLRNDKTQEGAPQIDILAEIRETEPGYPAASLSTNLLLLQSEDRGAIMSYDDTSGNYYFSEPVHRAFCHSLFASEQRQISFDTKPDSLEAAIRRLIPDIAELFVKQQLQKGEE